MLADLCVQHRRFPLQDAGDEAAAEVTGQHKRPEGADIGAEGIVEHPAGYTENRATR